MKPHPRAVPSALLWAKPFAPAPVPGEYRPPGKRLSLALQLLAILAGLIIPVFLGLRRMGHPASLVDAMSLILPWLAFPVTASLVIALAARAWRGALLPALATCMLLGLYGPYYLPRSMAQASGPTFTAMTYNVLYSARQVQPFLDQVAAHAPDLVAFQEFQPPKSLAIAAALTDRYPYQAVAGTYGLFSRFPLAGCDLIYSTDQGSDIAQRCSLDIGGRPLTVFNVHLRTPTMRLARLPALDLPIVLGLAPARRDGDLDVLFAHTDRSSGPQLVLGDFNLADQSPSYDQMRARWSDAFRSAGWGLGFTFHSAELPFPTWRIDYILHSADLAALEAYLGWFDGSDHRPVIARLGFK